MSKLKLNPNQPLVSLLDDLKMTCKTIVPGIKFDF